MEQLPIRRLTGSRQPTRWVATFWDDDGIDMNSWIVEHEQKRRVKLSLSMSPQAFWYRLENLVSKGQHWWIAGWRMYEMLCWSDFYHRISSNVWTCSVPTKIVNGKYVKESLSRLFGCLVCENPPTIIDVAKISGGSVRFVDLANWGMKPQHFLEDGENETLDTAVQAIEDYTLAVKELGMGTLKTTAAAQGWGCYRTSHMHHELIPNQIPNVRELERASYFSGRAEAFRIGAIQERLYHVDVSGMYNSFGRKNYFPTQLLYKCSSSNIAREQIASQRVQYIADVTVETGEPCYPLRHDGVVIFPVGRFRTSLAHPELCHARDSGHIIEIHSSACYASHQIFAGFSDWYFKALGAIERLGLCALKPSLKLLGNSTFGKIGSRGKNWTDVEWRHTKDKWAQWWGTNPRLNYVTQFRALDGVVSYLDGKNEPAESMPSISATMNSYGRMELWRLMKKAGRHNVYYVDTDGLIVNETGFRLLSDEVSPIGHEPGLLDVREQGEDAEIFGIKHYRFEERVCCAGVTVGRQHSSDGSVLTIQHEPFTYGLWHKNPFYHSYDEIWKRYLGHYKHGHKNSDGTISPWFVAPVYEGVGNDGKTVDEKLAYKIVGSYDPVTRKSSRNDDLQTAND